MGRLKSILTTATYQMDTARYHWIHRRLAKTILQNIEAGKGKTDRKFIRLSNEYAGDVLGWKGYAPWLYVYSAISGSFKEGWIPDNYYGRVVVRHIQGYYGRMSFLKPLSQKIVDTSLFPDLGYLVHGTWFSKDWEPLVENDLAQVLFKASEKIVFKVDHSAQGDGVFICERAHFDQKEIKKLGNGVFQNYVQQHPFFKELMPSSVATLRITTVIDKNKDVSARSCYLRLGRNGETHVKSTSHIRIPVDVQSGTLEALGYLHTWCPVDRHPDTKVLFENKKIPNFENCLAAVLKLHASIPFIGCIGWDVVVDHSENIQIMEWNGYSNDIKFSEATQGPCFSDLGWEKLWKENHNKKIKIDLNWQFEGKLGK